MADRKEMMTRYLELCAKRNELTDYMEQYQWLVKSEYIAQTAKELRRVNAELTKLSVRMLKAKTRTKGS